MNVIKLTTCGGVLYPPQSGFEMDREYWILFRQGIKLLQERELPLFGVNEFQSVIKDRLSLEDISILNHAYSIDFRSVNNLAVYGFSVVKSFYGGDTHTLDKQAAKSLIELMGTNVVTPSGLYGGKLKDLGFEIKDEDDSSSRTIKISKFNGELCWGID